MATPAQVKIGTAGWSYPHWDGVVYPKPHPRGFHPVEYLATYLDCLEINSSFYRPLEPQVTKLWIRKAESNPNFLFSAKLHQGFTHGRQLRASEVVDFKEGLWPLLRAGKLGALLMQFPWSFRFTTENRAFLVQLRRAFHEFPLAAEMRHASWMSEEGVGTLLDYKIAFCNIDQPEYARAMPPTSFLTAPFGYVRLHGRNPQNSLGAFQVDALRQAQHDYLYSDAELTVWQQRIERVRKHSEYTMVVFNNDASGKSVVNALQLRRRLAPGEGMAPLPLLQAYRLPLAGFRAMTANRQPGLFLAA
jgi:uncharacterized protein YecE (DUF72 family)